MGIRVELRIPDLAVEFLLWNDHLGLGVHGDRGIFYFSGVEDLDSWGGDIGGCHGRPQRVY